MSASAAQASQMGGDGRPPVASMTPGTGAAQPGADTGAAQPGAQPLHLRRDMTALGPEPFAAAASSGASTVVHEPCLALVRAQSRAKELKTKKTDLWKCQWRRDHAIQLLKENEYAGRNTTIEISEIDRWQEHIDRLTQEIQIEEAMTRSTASEAP